MAGYVLGTGSGVLAAAAMYYTLSSSISQTTTSLQAELERSKNLLNNSFDPQTPPAPSTFVGPSYPYQPRFGDILRERWNVAIGRAYDTVRETDWAGMGLVVVDETGKLVKRLSSDLQAPSASSSSAAASTSEAISRSREAIDRGMDKVSREVSHAEEKVKEIGKESKSWFSSLTQRAKSVEDKAESALHRAEKKADAFSKDIEEGMAAEKQMEAYGVGVVGGDLRKESYTSGSERWVKAMRQNEQEKGRLV